MTTQLSEKVKELITKARIVSFSSWESEYLPEIITIFQMADDEGRYLTDRDLETIGSLSPQSVSKLEIARQLRDLAPDIVSEAREQVLTQFPGITEPGGALYPEVRSESCWRDFWHFLRCVSYGVAGERTDFLSESGMHYMELLYQELKVPLDAMLCGLEGLKNSSCKRSPAANLAPYFDRLISDMTRFT
ncbi:phycobilisome protein [Merismopedia glauca]|uniref:Phycobilisome protein n=1 Tax=Merismopedia glauca CCAP 1448/3 TaxID=1296344 RepID=A0A2T1C2V6_9CYAN|nr:phycobilisome protein [Merismopedia glauca]PSB02600.1 phycobilisome protein [Merismopedia glauca CCAP 1448/3]